MPGPCPFFELGQTTDLGQHTVAVDFNDLAAVERELASGEFACLLTEPALTNCGMVPAQPGFIAGLRELTRRYGTLLVLDETHTISSARGGWARSAGIQPDFIVIGKPIAGGLPAAAYGFSAALAARMKTVKRGKLNQQAVNHYWYFFNHGNNRKRYTPKCN